MKDKLLKTSIALGLTSLIVAYLYFSRHINVRYWWVPALLLIATLGVYIAYLHEAGKLSLTKKKKVRFNTKKNEYFSW